MQHHHTEHEHQQHEHHQHNGHPMSHNGHGHSGHSGHNHKAMIADFRKRFYVVLVLTIPTMLLSPMIQQWLGFDLNFTGSNYILAGLATIIFIYGGWPFLKGLVSELKGKNPGMMTLIGFAITVAFVYSSATVFGLKGSDFFWELATLILIMLLGHWIEMRSVAGASKELELLVQLMPADAHLMKDGNTKDVPTDSLKPEDRILIKPGEKIAADGIIVDGNSHINESMLTGESRPVNKEQGDEVIAGSINGNGALQVKVSHSSKESYLSQVIQLVSDAQKSKSATQLMADKAARWLTLIAIASGIITFIAWYVTGHELAYSIERMVTVVVICCPHALGLAVPLVVARSTTLSAKQGLLIKDRTSFENSRKVTTVVFDKTGTLTIGDFKVVNYTSYTDNYSDKEILGLAAAIEGSSEHPIAVGIVQKAKEEELSLPEVSDVAAITGKGISAKQDKKSILIVSPGYLKEQQIDLPEQQDDAGTQVYILIDNKLAGSIMLADEIREESYEAVKELKQEGIKSMLLTGDNKKVAKAVADKLGMEDFIAEVLPHEKLEHIKDLQSKGAFVAMTGDGINDAPALAQADIGIAIGSGSDIAAETAGIVLVNSNPMDVSALIKFGKATYRKMTQNLAWATGYNVIAMPLAAGVLFKWGVILSPAVGAVLMTLSTVIVAINASFLKVR